MKKKIYLDKFQTELNTFLFNIRKYLYAYMKKAFQKQGK